MPPFKVTIVHTICPANSNWEGSYSELTSDYITHRPETTLVWSDKKPLKLRIIMLVKLCSYGKRKIWSKISVIKAGCDTDSFDLALRLNAYKWKNSSLRNFGFSPPLFFFYIYADCTSVGPVIFNKILPRTAFYTWETANSRLIQQKARGTSI